MNFKELYEKGQQLVYVIGPFRDKRGPWYNELNIRKAEKAALWLWQKGFAVICPHTNTRFFEGAADAETWLRGDLLMLSRCDFAVVMPRAKSSEGSQMEIDQCDFYDMPCFWFTEFKRAFNKDVWRNLSLVIDYDEFRPEKMKNPRGTGRFYGQSLGKDYSRGPEETTGNKSCE